MSKPLISIIAAISENRALGKNNKLLWHIPQDLERFKKITLGHPVIMGRKTFESLGKPLPGRLNIVVTRNTNYQIYDCVVFSSLNKAIEYAKGQDNKEIFIIGGGQIYQQGINIADKLYLTVVKGKFLADTFFPEYKNFTRTIFEKKGRFNQYQFTFFELLRD